MKRTKTNENTNNQSFQTFQNKRNIFINNQINLSSQAISTQSTSFNNPLLNRPFTTISNNNQSLLRTSTLLKKTNSINASHSLDHQKSFQFTHSHSNNNLNTFNDINTTINNNSNLINNTNNYSNNNHGINTYSISVLKTNLHQHEQKEKKEQSTLLLPKKSYEYNSRTNTREYQNDMIQK